MITFTEFLKTQIEPSDAQLAVASRIQEALDDHKNLLIATPPRFGKSSIAKALSAYALISNPTSRALYSTYMKTLTDDTGRQIKSVIGDYLSELLYLQCPGTGGAGIGYNVAVLDDPVNFAKMDAESAPTSEWIVAVVLTHIRENGSCIVFTTRKCAGDFYDKLMELSDGRFETMSVPAVVERPTSSMVGFTTERLAEIRREVGEAVWAATYQTRPISI